MVPSRNWFSSWNFVVDCFSSITKTTKQIIRTCKSSCPACYVDGCRSLPPCASCEPPGGTASGFGRSKSHSLLGQAITGPDFKNFSTRNSLPQVGHFSAIGFPAEVNLHFG